jgi:hypothetical protein
LAPYALEFDILFHNLPFLVQFFNARFFSVGLCLENEFYFGRFCPAPTHLQELYVDDAPLVEGGRVAGPCNVALSAEVISDNGLI